MKNVTRQRFLPTHLTLILVVTTLLAELSPLFLTTTSAQAATQPVELRLTLGLAPARDLQSNVAMPGELLQLDVRVENVGRSEAPEVAVAFPYRPEQFLVQDNTAIVQPRTAPGREASFVLLVGTISPGAFSNARATLLVQQSLPTPTQLILHPTVFVHSSIAPLQLPPTPVAIQIEAPDPNEGNDARVVTITADTTPPESAMRCVRVAGSGVNVRWEGRDAESGVRSYDVQVRQLPSSYWSDWGKALATTEAWFGPTEGRQYSFRVRARDQWGNFSPWSAELSMAALVNGATPSC